MEKFIQNLFLQSSVTRFNIQYVKNKQNLAEHQYNVAVLSLVIFEELFLNSPELFHTDYNINTTSLLINALFHDFSEAVTGDIPYPLKRELSEDSLNNIKEIENKFIKDSFSPLNAIFETLLFSAAKNLTDEDKNLQSIIKLADYLECWIYCKLSYESRNLEKVKNKCLELVKCNPMFSHSSVTNKILNLDLD